MNRRQACCFGAGVLAGALAAAGWWVYERRPRERVVGFEELDDPDIAAAFTWVSGLPQMALLRWWVARRARALRARGLAADLGCGPGLLALELARQAPGLQVIGLDLAEGMVRQGQERARQAGLSGRVLFRLGDVESLPFADDSLDLVVSTLSLHHWRDPVRVLDEIERVLVPGGGFVILDLRRDLSAPAYLLLWFAQNVVLPEVLRRADEPLGSRHAAYTPEEAARLVEQSRLRGWRISQGPLWLILEGRRA